MLRRGGSKAKRRTANVAVLQKAIPRGLEPPAYSSANLHASRIAPKAMEATTLYTVKQFPRFFFFRQVTELTVALLARGFERQMVVN